MPTSARELEALRDQAHDLVRAIEALLAVQRREEAATPKLAEPPARLNRIP